MLTFSEVWLDAFSTPSLALVLVLSSLVRLFPPVPILFGAIGLRSSLVCRTISPAFPHSIALSRIEQELGAPAEQLFEEFPSSPIAAASLGQVYKARLEGQSWVAVKVQGPTSPLSSAVILS
jgi:hypothetical protein